MNRHRQIKLSLVASISFVIGCTICGADRSGKMLAIAKRLIAKVSAETKNSVSFDKSSIENLGEPECDDMMTMDVIEYLDSDYLVFRISAKTMRSNSYLVALFRNRLFNLFSHSLQF